MTDFITRYIREYRDDTLTDPTMLYVSHECFSQIRVSGVGFHVWFYQYEDEYRGEMVVKINDDPFNDGRTMLVTTVFIDSPTFQDWARENMIDASRWTFYGVEEIRVVPQMTEYKLGEPRDMGNGVIEFDGIPVRALCQNNG